MMKLNLGSENQVLEGWENLDPRWEKFPGVKPWKWNEKLPYEDGSADLVLVQHSLMYCKKEDYNWNLKEINRVLCVGSKFILKEEDDRVYQWRKLGTKHRTGHIIGATNPVDILLYLTNNGFGNFVNDKDLLIKKYGVIINRLHKLHKGWLFIVEAEKIKDVK